MPEFATPEPIAVTIDLGAGNLRIAASDRTDTVVDVRPTDDSDESDVKAAQQVQVEFANGVLTVKGPRFRAFDFSKKTRSVDVSIDLPSGSQVSGDVQIGDLATTGRLGELGYKTSAGDLHVERTGALRLRTSAGHVTAGAVTGNAEIHTGSGKVRLGQVDGTAVIKNSNGAIDVDAVTGPVRARSANGDIAVEHAGAGVEVKTANGNIRLGEVVRGSVEIGTAMGDLEIGIADGTAAWLEVNTSFGKVRNLMEDATSPGDAAETVEVRGRTSYGDITIRRS
ncbi:hypothetical protein Lesp02_74560 [Lentzea sp. NBRC 105346]|uniref:DUF4097 family beta strand repeat-containing protein n=1 Tax=Lentzea sp. NBRC 105346 TaxID=3032205 RepID=UPI0024A16533|nr:DUF4097 family beta strand repeat-containing protein [Lentzea sp. NBRC 105346]GLZ35269.1 hypothetical protein Lesp02_74560 [Lentzea sp. NBRC 105346]